MRRFAVLVLLDILSSPAIASLPSGSSSAVAGEASPAPSTLLPPPSQSLSDADTPPSLTIYAFMAAHGECRSASDGCMICQRGETDFVCSTPGIACMTRAAMCDVTLPKVP